MKTWLKIFVSFLIVVISLVLIFSSKTVEIVVIPTGSLVLTTSSIGFLIVICLLLVIYQYKGRKKGETRFEEEFTRQLLSVKSPERVKEIINRYKERSSLAHALDNPKIDAVSLTRKILNTYSQKKVKRTIEYLRRIGKEYQALGTIIKHLISHKKLAPYQAYLLEKELKHFMPKRDIIGLYERRY